MKRVIFTVVLLGALGLFAWTVRRFTRLLLAGRPDLRTDHPGDRVLSVLTYFFGQKKVVEKTVIPAARARRLVSTIGSKYHFIIFWGFIVITVGTAETLVQGIFPSFALTSVLGQTLGDFLYASIDVSNVLVLAMIAFAVFRRVVLQPRLIPMSRDAAAILGAIAALMITHYGIHGLRAAAGVPDPALPISNAIGAALGGLPASAALALSEVSSWLHVFIVLG